MQNSPKIYLGTGGYSDTDLIGTLYPHGSHHEDFLSIYSQHYDALELNSTFHAPIGHKALQGMVEKAAGRLRFSIKIHQDFSHRRSATSAQASGFLKALSPLIEADVLAHLFIQFPSNFERTVHNRHYLAACVSWFEEYPLAVEFRHSSWHIPAVLEAFQNRPQLIWCNVDYPQHIGLPDFHFHLNQRQGYLRLHGRNPNWWKAQSAQERHDYRYSEAELQALSSLLHQRRKEFDVLYIYFQNTTKSHAYYNIETLRKNLAAQGFTVKAKPEFLLGQQSLFD